MERLERVEPPYFFVELPEKDAVNQELLSDHAKARHDKDATVRMHGLQMRQEHLGNGRKHFKPQDCMDPSQK